MKNLIAVFGGRAQRAAARFRGNLCAPVVARSNERSLVRVLAAQKEDLHICLANLETGKLRLYSYAVAVFLCSVLMLILFWANIRKQRREFELRIQQRDSVIKELRGEVSGLRNGRQVVRRIENQGIADPFPSACAAHVLQDYAAEIDNCLQQ